MALTHRTLTFVLALACGVVSVAVPRVAKAADQKAALAKIKTHYQAAAAAYDDGDLPKTQAQLQQALKVADDNGVSSQKLVAQVYLLYGVLQVAGLKDTEKGVKLFARALDISPAIQVPPTMASKAVLAAFDRAENQESDAAEAPKHPAAPDETEEALLKPAEPARPTRAAKSEPPPRSDSPRSDSKRSDSKRSDPANEKLVDDLAAAKVTESLQQAEKDRIQREKQEQDKELASTKGRAQQLAKEKQEQEKQLADAKARLQQLAKEKQEQDKQLADAKARLQQLTKEKQDEDKQLAASQAGEKKEREASNKLAHDKSEGDKQLAEDKRTLLELTKQKADADRQLATARDEAKKEREAKEKVEHQKAETDKQLAEEKRSLLELTKQKADTDRQLVAARDEAKKEREANEKLVAARREADARDAERKNKELQERAAREKLAEGPALPPHVSEPISCTIPDEVAPGADLFVHCVPRPGIDAKVVALYYRSGGGVLYNVSTMDRSKKGWYTALIPGGKIAGKVLHYYVEARDNRQDVVGANGHANSPNVATIRPGKPH
jgi:hypothetical protein